MEKKKLTVVITLNNGEQGLISTLQSIKKQKYRNYKVIIIGNVSTDILKKDIDNLNIDLQFISFSTDNIGSQLNSIIDIIDTPYIMFMGTYDTLSSNYMKACIYELDNHKEAALSASRSFCINPLMTKTSVESIFSKKYMDHTYCCDIYDAYHILITTLDSTIIRTDIVKKLGLQEELSFEYGADLILKILLLYKKYMIVSEAKYFYFAPRENQVLYHTPSHDIRWYTESLQNYILPLLDYAEERLKTIPPFLQNYAVYYLNCRMMANKDNRNKKVLLNNDLDIYLESVQSLLQRIDDFYILNQDQLPYITKNPEVRCMYLRIKYGSDNIKFTYRACEGEDGKDLEMLFHDYLITSLSTHRFTINVMNYIQGNIWIDGSLISVFQHSDVEFYAKFNNQIYEVKDTQAYSLTKYFGMPGYRRFTYHLELPLNTNKKMQRITFFAKVQGEEYQMKISFANHWAKLSKSPRYSYWKFNKYLCHHANNGIDIKLATKFNVLKREIQFQLNLIKNHKRKDFHALGFRWLYWITHPYFKNKKIWLMLDKLYKGGDSCEYLYRYCANIEDGVTKYYLINKDTSDYQSLERDGYKPLINGSLKHKLVFVNADIVLITNSHLFPFNGYNKGTSKYIRGICNFGSMCLQHGLSVQKCAIAQRRIIDNTMMYFLASKFEYENLSKKPYGYQGFDILKITGIGRYDGLKNNDKKQILLSPTWRMYNALPVTTSEGEQRGYNPEFKNSIYFHVYNDLINNEQLIACAKKFGYKIKFLLHPILSSQIDDFTPNSELEVIPSVGDLSYEKILTESSLMVTDYSGVQFDFAYMRKPIVYFHPEVLPPHYDDGIFFYDSMGFGEICTKSEQLVNILCDYMEKGCEMKEIYKKRADDFYAYDDYENCERIYQEIINYQKIIDKDKLRNK